MSLLKCLLIAIRGLLLLYPATYCLFQMVLFVLFFRGVPLLKAQGEKVSCWFCFDLKISGLLFERNFPRQRCDQSFQSKDWHLL